MRIILLFLSLTLFYFEQVYQLISHGGVVYRILFLVPVILLLASLESMVLGFCGKRVSRVLFYVILGVEYIFYCAQLVYFSIFKQPLLFAAVGNAGADALTTYWREALTGIVSNWYGILLLALPIVIAVILDKKKKLTFSSIDVSAGFFSLLWSAVAGCALVVLLLCGYYTKAEYYHDYQGYYDPLSLVESYGLSPTLARSLMGEVLPEAEEDVIFADSAAVVSESSPAPETPIPTEAPQETAIPVATEAPQETMAPTAEPIDTSPHVFTVDFEALRAKVDTKAYRKVVSAYESLEPTNKNEYTGMFEGYNLIYLTAEGFSPYVVSEELTPTLYKLLNEGIIAKNYYVPLWQTSTSDGEYVNLTGLIPNQQFSMKRSGVNRQPYSLGAYFAGEGVYCYGFHNGTLSYYDRYISHPNMGYDFMASTLGDLSEEEWGHKIFPMENANKWPSSDLDMMKATLPYYLNQERFHVYYMTISGHLNYNFLGNSMSGKNKALVQDLPYSTEGKAYIACSIELDRALEYLLAELETAGKLEKTVIAMSADHYPYGMNVDNYEELAGRELEDTLDIYRNSLVLWNSEMEPIVVEKPCCSVDVLPTLLNLFGFAYDSRLYAGRDILSDSEGLVIFSDRSFITDTMQYNKKTKELIYTGEGVAEEEYETMKSLVKTIYDYSAGILNQDFYKYVEECRIVN